jgi:hypothetical protein
VSPPAPESRTRSRPRRLSAAAIRRLYSVDEPLDLLRRLRRSAAQDPLRARSEAARLVAGRLWRRWREELAPRGVRPALLRAWVAGGDLEVWLWVAGDRSWPQVLDAIVGRVVRRVGSVTATGTPSP